MASALRRSVVMLGQLGLALMKAMYREKSAPPSSLRRMAHSISFFATGSVIAFFVSFASVRRRLRKWSSARFVSATSTAEVDTVEGNVGAGAAAAGGAAAGTAASAAAVPAAAAPGRAAGSGVAAAGLAGSVLASFLAAFDLAAFGFAVDFLSALGLSDFFSAFAGFFAADLSATGVAWAAASTGIANANKLATASEPSDFGQFQRVTQRSPIRRLESRFEANTYSVDKIDES